MTLVTPLQRCVIDLYQGGECSICYRLPMERIEQRPGEPAQRAGEYEELNPFGTPTGWSVYAEQGKPLPPLPRGFTWRHSPPREC